MNFIKELWRGEKSLAFTFWVMWVAVIFSYNLYLADAGLFDGDLNINQGLFWAAYWFFVIYSYFIFVCVWRSAGAYSKQVNHRAVWLGRYAKLFVSIYILRLTIVLWVEFVAAY